MMLWQQLAQDAWAAVDTRPLTRDEKLGLICEAVAREEQRYAAAGSRGGTGFYSWPLDTLRTPLSTRETVSLCSRHAETINALLSDDGVQRMYRYVPSEYRASGARPFGRGSGGRARSATSPAYLQQMPQR